MAIPYNECTSYMTTSLYHELNEYLSAWENAPRLGQSCAFKRDGATHCVAPMLMCRQGLMKIDFSQSDSFCHGGDLPECTPAQIDQYDKWSGVEQRPKDKRAIRS